MLNALLASLIQQQVEPQLPKDVSNDSIRTDDSGSFESSPRPSLYPKMHCRACLKDPADELTATMCGHLFCYSYVSSRSGSLFAVLPAYTFVVQVHYGSCDEEFEMPYV